MLEQSGIVIHKGLKPLNVDILDINSKSITYSVKHTPICQFDQHSRARVGVKFFDYEVSLKPSYVMYTSNVLLLEQNEELKNKTFETLLNLENLRESLHFKEPLNLMSRSCSYKVEQTWESLVGQMQRRLKLCEEEFIVGLHWLLRYKISEQKRAFTEVYERLFLPGCDKIEKCDYSSADYLSNAFGCLFSGCGRWPLQTEYASFNQSCTTYKQLEEQLGITIQKTKYGS